MLINANSPHMALGEDLSKQGHKVVFCEFQPTCENMLYEIAKKKSEEDYLSIYIFLILKLHETGKTLTENGSQRIIPNID